MTISAISPSTSASPISNFQAFRQDFSQLTSALQSGDLSSAQSAYTTLSSSPLAQGNSPFAQAIQQIGQYLKDGDLADAQKALTADASNTSSTGNANPADPDNDGDTSNNETVINIQITASSGSANKVDIQA
jgi:hypothetical protein